LALRATVLVSRQIEQVTIGVVIGLYGALAIRMSYFVYAVLDGASDFCGLI
jgi:hypothetical protein